MFDRPIIALKDEEEMEDFHDYDDEEHSELDSKLDDYEDDEDEDDDEADEIAPPCHNRLGAGCCGGAAAYPGTSCGGSAQEARETGIVGRQSSRQETRGQARTREEGRETRGETARQESSGKESSG